jgi:hypothetical protein
MGIGLSLLLIAAGAILAWGVTGDVQGLDITAIGVIIMVVGLVGLVLTFIFWQSWWGPGYFRRTRYAAGPGARRRYGPWGGRGEYVEEEEDVPPPPAGPPY